MRSGRKNVEARALVDASLSVAAQLNIAVIKTAMTEAERTAQAALTAKDAQELIGLQQGALQPVDARIAAYSCSVYRSLPRPTLK